MGLYAWLIYCVIHKDLSVGNFTLYLGSAATFFSYMVSVLGNITALLARNREVDDFRSFMDIDSDLKEGGDPIPKYDTYEFTFEDVWFKFPNAEEYAVK